MIITESTLLHTSADDIIVGNRHGSEATKKGVGPQDFLAQGPHTDRPLAFLVFTGQIICAGRSDRPHIDCMDTDMSS